MPQVNKPRVAVSDTARQMILDAAAALEVENEQEDEQQNGMHIHVHTGAAPKPTADADPETDTEDKSPMGLHMKKVEDTVQKMADSMDAFLKAAKPTPAADAAAIVNDHEGAGVVGDSKALETSFKAVMSDAEVLVPGFSMPTFDAAATRAVTVDSMCNTRRRVLDAAMLTASGKTMIETLSPGLNTATADCATVAVAFRAAAGAKKLLNNGGRATNDSMQMADPNAGKPKPRMSLAELNAQNRRLYPV